MKQLILGRFLGRAAIFLRAKAAIQIAAWRHPELVGTVANDHLAALLITRLCRTDGTFIDVGAHIGSILSEVQSNLPSVKIVAVEADPQKSRRLSIKFPKVTVHNVAAGDHDACVSFFVDLHRPGCSSLNRPAETTNAGNELKVSMRRLDDLIPSHKDVDVIKMDIEGAELIALRGSTMILSEGRPTVMFESGSLRQESEAGKRDLWKHLASNDYVVVVPNRVAHDDDGLSCDGFVESHVYPRRCTNYFAIARERRTEIRDLARNVLGIFTG